MKFGLFAINMGPCSDPVTASASHRRRRPPGDSPTIVDEARRCGRCRTESRCWRRTRRPFDRGRAEELRLEPRERALTELIRPLRVKREGFRALWEAPARHREARLLLRVRAGYE